MLNRRGGYIPGHEIVSALRERQKWIQDEQTQTIPANDLTFLVRFVLLGLAAVGLAIWLVGCDGDVTIYGIPKPVNERELANDKAKESEPCEATAPAKPSC